MNNFKESLLVVVYFLIFLLPGFIIMIFVHTIPSAITATMIIYSGICFYFGWYSGKNY
jgi:hypothetical protein